MQNRGRSYAERLARGLGDAPARARSLGARLELLLGPVLLRLALEALLDAALVLVAARGAPVALALAVRAVVLLLVVRGGRLLWLCARRCGARVVGRGVDGRGGLGSLAGGQEVVWGYYTRVGRGRT